MQQQAHNIINFTLLCWLAIFSTNAIGNTDTYCVLCDDPASDGGSFLEGSLGILEDTQRTFGEYIYSAGERIDLFFGDDNEDLIHRGSQLKVRFPVRFYENGDIDTNIQFSAQLDLPRTNHRWKLFMASYQQSMDDSNENISTTRGSTVATGRAASVENDVGSIGLFYDLLSQNNITGKLDFGVNLSSLTVLDPFVRLKGRHSTKLFSQLVSQQTQRLFWEGRKGVSWDLQQVFDYDLNGSTLLRSQTSGLWWIGGEYLELNQKLIAFNTVNSDRVVAYYAYWQWDDSLGGPIRQTEITTGINVRERLHKDWLFIEVEPRLKLRVEDNFKKVEASILIMLEMMFYSDSQR
ncbi:MAG: hypothetical protein ISEC1_P0487 [Thiomicrorhabdus sp.]|nr:MAG: hypothetical protein ISEC1_P0487 [Thiomicrorhabdus sp.]